MDRRHFCRLSAAGLIGPYFSLPSWITPSLRQAQEVNGQRLNQRMNALSAFGANAEGGIDRVAFSDANIQALDWISQLLEEVGFASSTDFAGNLIARKPGSISELPPIMVGSHIDSVPGGGNFDGQVGSMSAIEVAASLADGRRGSPEGNEATAQPDRVSASHGIGARPRGTIFTRVFERRGPADSSH